MVPRNRRQKLLQRAGGGVHDGCGEVLCQTNLNALGELEVCYDVYISRQSPFFSVTQNYYSLEH